jgi:murein DD-endopeptidase MepM/ murein hydrolase activator NlpD
VSPALDVAGCDFHPVIRLPTGYEVYDFTRGYDPARALASPYGVGRYDEKRRGMYVTELFVAASANGAIGANGASGARDVHVGIDLGAPVGEPVHAFWQGEIHKLAYNGAPGDYGHTLVTHHVIGGRDVWALFGHLSARSLEGRAEGQPIARSEVIGWVGDRHENGGWNPHVHVQLSLVRPDVADLPGAVNDADRAQALRIYPDPRLVLGPLY